MVKTVVTAVILALLGFLLVNFIGLGIAENGAVGIALGLLIGVLVGGRESLISEPSPQPARHSHEKTARTEVRNTPSVASESAGTLSIFVGNLTYKTRGRQLASIFEPYGEIVSLRIVKDRDTGKAKGFGFVEMHAVDAKKAITELDGKEFYGRNLKVCEANSQKNDGEN